MSDGPGEITELLRRGDDPAAEQQLLSLVYDDLRKLAHRFMRRERRNHTVQATALLHEVWVALVHDTKIDLQDRVHFFALAAKSMRRILAEYARAQHTLKRGGNRRRIELSGTLAVAEAQLDTVLLVDHALNQLMESAPRQARIVEMRYFGGLTEDEIVAILGVSVRTVQRDWSMAKGWLAVHAGGPDASPMSEEN